MVWCFLISSEKLSQWAALAFSDFYLGRMYLPRRLLVEIAWSILVEVVSHFLEEVKAVL